MDPHKSPVERAFELARSGGFNTVDDIRRRVKAEGYDEHAIHGRSLYLQLKALIASSKQVQ